jgi:hypothetical protein
VNLQSPATNTVQITTADTTTNGAGATQLMVFGGGGGTLLRIYAYAIGPTARGEIRIFHAPGSGANLWIGTIDVPETNPKNAEERWRGVWEASPEDPVNGLLMSINDEIHVSTYESNTFNVTGVGAKLPTA